MSRENATSVHPVVETYANTRNTHPFYTLYQELLKTGVPGISFGEPHRDAHGKTVEGTVTISLTGESLRIYNKAKDDPRMIALFIEDATTIGENKPTAEMVQATVKQVLTEVTV